MTVNIYDDLNRLEATFRKTTEFAEVEQAVEVVKEDEEALALFKNFRKIQLDFRKNKWQGEEIEPKNSNMHKKQHSSHSQTKKLWQCLKQK